MIRAARLLPVALLAAAAAGCSKKESPPVDAATKQAQARVMLTSALSYIQEAARMGWTWKNPQHPNFKSEAFGWIDARDGSPGPKDRWMNVMARDAGGNPLFDPVTGLSTTAGGGVFPAVGGRAVRCPMTSTSETRNSRGTFDPVCTTVLRCVSNSGRRAISSRKKRTSGLGTHV